MIRKISKTLLYFIAVNIPTTENNELPLVVKLFVMLSGTPVRFSNWADGEPDHLEFGIGRIEQNCIYMKADKRFRWSSLQCSTAWDIPSICQYGG